MNGSLLRFVGRTAATVLGLVLVLVIVVHGGSETMLRHQYELPSHAPFAAPTSADSAPDGEIGQKPEARGRSSRSSTRHCLQF